LIIILGGAQVLDCVRRQLMLWGTCDISTYYMLAILDMRECYSGMLYHTIKIQLRD
jgi:hypothetical protein